MQSRTRFRKATYAIVSALIACVVVLTYEAAGRFVRSPDIGRLHDLINQPGCWALDDERNDCELHQ
jgi:hypothetical protein